MPEERMDVEKQLTALNKALRLQYRSVLQEQVDYLLRARRTP